MPVKPHAVIYQCGKCSWKCIYAPPSDLLLVPPPKICKKCGSSELSGTAASALDELMAAVGLITESKTHPFDFNH